MNDSEKVYLFKNTWHIFSKTGELLAQIIDNQGQKLVSMSDVKKLERKLKSKMLTNLVQYLEAMKTLLSTTDKLHFYYLPSHLYSEYQIIHQNLTHLTSTIRSIRSLYKYHSFLEKFAKEISKIESGILITLNQLAQKLFNSPYDIEHPQQILKNHENPDKDLAQLPELWYSFEALKHGMVELNFTPYSWMKWFDEIETLDFEYRNIQKATKNHQVNFLELTTTSPVTNHPTLSITAIKYEFLFSFFTKNVIKFSYPHFKDKKQKKEDAKNLDLQINHIFNQNMANIAKKYGIVYIFNEHTIATKEIPHIIKLQLEEYQEQITQKYQGDLNAANKEFFKFGSKFFKLLDDMDKWVKAILPLIDPWKNALRKIQNMINQLRGEVSRKLDDFEQYSISVEENTIKVELEQSINKQIKRLEVLLQDYQDKTAPFLDNLPELSPIIPVINEFDTRALSLKNRMNKLFKEYSEKNINITNSIEYWEEKYKEILNRSKFSLRSSLIRMFNQFSDVLEKENALFNTIQDATAPTDDIDLFAMESFSPEGFSENDIRFRIDKISSKITNLDTRKRNYEEEKKRFLNLLEVKLSEKGLKSKKCIICHKPVQVAEDHFIKCEFCEALSHYTCAVWWIQKYNSCPVCHNKYTVPGNQLFDPNQLES